MCRRCPFRLPGRNTYEAESKTSCPGALKPAMRSERRTCPAARAAAQEHGRAGGAKVNTKNSTHNAMAPAQLTKGPGPAPGRRTASGGGNREHSSPRKAAGNIPPQAVDAENHTGHRYSQRRSSAPGPTAAHSFGRPKPPARRMQQRTLQHAASKNGKKQQLPCSQTLSLTGAQEPDKGSFPG